MYSIYLKDLCVKKKSKPYFQISKKLLPGFHICSADLKHPRDIEAQLETAF